MNRGWVVIVMGLVSSSASPGFVKTEIVGGVSFTCSVCRTTNIQAEDGTVRSVELDPRMLMPPLAMVGDDENENGFED
jgi:hypothetical protein